jgi:hypothetical protein
MGNLWDLKKPLHSNIFIGLAVAALYEIAQTSYPGTRSRRRPRAWPGVLGQPAGGRVPLLPSAAPGPRQRRQRPGPVGRRPRPADPGSGPTPARDAAAAEPKTPEQRRGTRTPSVVIPNRPGFQFTVSHYKQRRSLGEQSPPYKFPRAACSLSIASNRLLKLPLPKASLPRRWMISKKRVGRSSTGLVKICSR